MTRILVTLLVVLSSIAASLVASAQGEYQVESIESAPRDDAVSAEFIQKFSEKGYRIKSGSGRTIAEVWLCKQWDVDPNFQASEQRLYPFRSGDLIGLLHLSRKNSEFRNQEVPSGWYSLRFALQPVDGNHEGTSITRDFLLLISLERDEPEKKWAEKEMFGASGESIGATHPAMLSLQRAEGDQASALRHESEKDWWILRTIGTGIANGKSQAMPVDLVVVGHAPE